LFTAHSCIICFVCVIVNRKLFVYMLICYFNTHSWVALPPVVLLQVAWALPQAVWALALPVWWRAALLPALALLALLLLIWAAPVLPLLAPAPLL
jgi:hypothetical protein